MNTAHWHGAQWVLLTYWGMATAMPALIKFCRQPLGVKWKDQFTRFVDRAVLFGMLWWGGFWS